MPCKRTVGLAGCGLIYGGLGLVLWPVPLIGLLHVESAALVALVAFFVAGGWTWQFLHQGGRLSDALRRQLLLLLIPWGLLTLTMLWRPNCDYGRGVVFFLLFPPVSVVLAVALADALHSMEVRHGRRWLAGIGLGLCVFPVAYDLLLYPQLYTYNHVFGGVLGPLYDEALVLRPGLLSFRALTLLWAYWLVLVARFHRTPRLLQDRWWPALGGVTLLLGAFYLLAVPLGFNTSTATLMHALPGQVTRGAVTLHYDPRWITREEAMMRAYRAAYDYDRMARRLGIVHPEPVHVFLFSDPVRRAQLTGARYTSVALVWQRPPQIHLLQDRFDQSVAHELAHVLVRGWGLPGLGFSPWIGLVEGLAVALEPPDGRPTPHEQAAVAATLIQQRGTSLREQVAALLSPWGFWTSRSAVAYTLTGSFVRYLLDRFGPTPLRRVYGGGSFPAAYGYTLDSLLSAWEQSLTRLPIIDRSTQAFVMQRFRRPSLFERRCPHYVPPYARSYEAALRALRAGDTLRAESLLDLALRRKPDYLPALERWAYLRLLQGDAGAVRARLIDADTLALRVRLRLADALALTGAPNAARNLYRQLYREWPAYDLSGRGAIALRYVMAEQPDSLFWVLRQLEKTQGRCKIAPVAVSWAQALPLGWNKVLRWTALWWMLECGEDSFEQAVTRGYALATALRQVGAFNPAACVQETILWQQWLHYVFPVRRSVCCAYCAW
ncbi:MAG: hypothetical protein Q9M35_02605 [Rhodothermus sp.]|nr:hypothetical protein [Rhodothermus sp.]